MKNTSFLTQQISQKTPLLGVVDKYNLVLCRAVQPTSQVLVKHPVVVWGEVKGPQTTDPAPRELTDHGNVAFLGHTISHLDECSCPLESPALLGAGCTPEEPPVPPGTTDQSATSTLSSAIALSPSATPHPLTADSASTVCLTAAPRRQAGGLCSHLGPSHSGRTRAPTQLRPPGPGPPSACLVTCSLTACTLSSPRSQPPGWRLCSPSCSPSSWHIPVSTSV